MISNKFREFLGKFLLRFFSLSIVRQKILKNHNGGAREIPKYQARERPRSLRYCTTTYKQKLLKQIRF